MHRNSKAEEHYRRAGKYLRDTQDAYVFDPKSGTHQPKREGVQQPINIQVRSDIQEERPKANAAEITNAVIAGVGLIAGTLISILTLVGLAATVLFSIKQWKEARQTAVASIDSADAAVRSAQTAEGSLRVTQRQFELQNRAYLIPGDPVQKNYGLLKIPIRNVGHVSAQHAVLHARYQRLSQRITEKLEIKIVDQRTFAMKAPREVPPADVATFTWLVFLPDLSQSDREAVSRREQTFNVRGTVTYDSGFGAKDTVDVCYMYQNIRNQWEQCTGNITMWLGDLPTDPHSRKQK